MRPVRSGQSIELLLAEVCRLHHANAHALFEALGLYRGQLRVLRHLWENDGATQAELARALHVKSPTATRVLQGMERSGLVARRPDPRDRRVTRVQLSRSGKAARQRVRRALARLESVATRGLSETERRRLASLLGRVRDNLLGALPLEERGRRRRGA